MTDNAGRADFELRADTSALPGDFARAEQQARKSGQAVESAFGKQAAGGIGKANKAATGLRGTLSSPQLRQGLMQGLGLGAGAVGVLAIAKGMDLLKDAIGGSIGAAAELDEAMTESLAIMGDVSDELRGEMTDAARQMAKVTTFSAKEAADAYFYLASAGLDAAESMAALPKVAAFAQAGNFDLARATDLLTDAQSALGLTVDDTAVNMYNMTRVSDVLVKANTLANASVAQFSEALTNKGAAALRLVGKEIEEGTALLAAWADQGVKGAEAGTRLDIVLRDLQNAAIKNSDAFDGFGISVFDAEGEMRNMGDIIADLEAAFNGLSDRAIRAGLSQLGFQSKTVSATASLIGMSDKVRGYESDLKRAAGTTEDVAAKQLEAFNKKLGLLQDTVEDFGISLGTGIIDPLGDVADTIRNDVIPELEALFDELVYTDDQRFGRNLEKAWDGVRDAFHLNGEQVRELRKGYDGLLVSGYQLGNIEPTVESIALAIRALGVRTGLTVEQMARLVDHERRIASEATEAADDVLTLEQSLTRLNDRLDDYADARGLGALNKEIAKQVQLRNKAAKDGNAAAWARHQQLLREARQERRVAKARGEDFRAWKRNQAAQKRGEEELQAKQRQTERIIERQATKHDISAKKVKAILKEEGGDVDKLKERLRDMADGKYEPKITVHSAAALARIARVREALKNIKDEQVYIDITERGGRAGGGGGSGRGNRIRHSGGPTEPNKNYIIRQGEAWLATGPAAGQVVPLDRQGGGNTITVNVNAGGFLGFPEDAQRLGQAITPHIKRELDRLALSP